MYDGETAVIRVLLVEDNASDLRALEAKLLRSEIGFVVEHVGTLAAAKIVLMNRAIDVVLLDLSLPDSAGIDTVTSLHRSSPLTPIVVLSGHEDLQMASNCVREGASSYVVKQADLTTEQLEREALYAVERAKRTLSVGSLMYASALEGSLLPQVQILERGIDTLASYLRTNHPVAAEAMQTMLREIGVHVALQELRSVELKEETRRQLREHLGALQGLVRFAERPLPNPEPARQKFDPSLLLTAVTYTLLGLILGLALAVLQR